jgi:type III polyketide synthase
MDALAPGPGEDGGGGKAKDYVVGCAFGPGITVEMCMLKRHLAGSRLGMETPPETESEASVESEDGGEVSEGDGIEVERVDGEGKGEEKQISGRDCEKGSIDTRRREEEAFISEALERVELD